MKIAIISDIHGNIYALKAVVNAMKSQNIDVVFVLGDQMGYYYDVDKVYKELDQWNHYIISGNHERIFYEYLNENSNYNEKIDAKYGLCFNHYVKSLDKELIKRIQHLEEQKVVELDHYRFLLCHGSPLDKDQYIYPDYDKEVLDKCIDAANNVDVVFMGHTHYPMQYSNKNKQLINVGSIGQSRTVGGIANWGVFNTKNGIFTAQSTPYDTSKLIKDLKGTSNNYLLNILSRNNKLNEL